MATSKSTIRTTTIRINGKPVPTKTSAGKRKPMSEMDKIKAAKAKAKAR